MGILNLKLTKIILIDRVLEYHYISLLIRGAIKRFVNNINEGRGLISFLLADYANLLKREFEIKRGKKQEPHPFL